MKSSIVLSAAVLFGIASAVVTPLGCYKSSTGTKYKNTTDFNSIGGCGTDECLGSAVFATTERYKCYCGTSLPNDADKADLKNCNYSCPGWTPDNCGGDKGYFFFYDAGIANSLSKADSPDPKTSSASSSSSTSTTVSTIAQPEKTVVVTSSSKPTASSAPASKPNVAAIAAGVVVGVLAIAGIMGGLFFFMRNKKRRAIEEEHRRNATINSFTKPPINSAATSFNDTRLDPVMAHRRMSDGSIADNQDYSRRILKVTNA